MLVGSFLVAVSLIMLGWTKEIVGYFVAEGEFRRSCTVALAVVSIYAVDFAINAVQACCRSLIVDTLPISKQQTGSAWGKVFPKIERMKLTFHSKPNGCHWPLDGIHYWHNGSREGFRAFTGRHSV
jgi:hypothetical protein